MENEGEDGTGNHLRNRQLIKISNTSKWQPRQTQTHARRATKDRDSRQFSQKGTS